MLSSSIIDTVTSSDGLNSLVTLGEPFPRLKMSAYEKARLEKIAKNAALLEELGVSRAKSAVDAITPKPANKPKPSSASRPRKRVAPRAELPDELRRKSSRLTGTKIASMSEEEIVKRQEDDEAERDAARAAANLAKHGDRSLEAEQSVTGSGSTRTLTALLRQLTSVPEAVSRLGSGNMNGNGIKMEDVKETRIKKEEEEDTEGTPSPSKRPRLSGRVSTPQRSNGKPQDVKKRLKEDLDSPTEEGSLEDLQTACRGLSLRALVKVVPERIYSLCVHPTQTKDLVFAGDKSGHLGLWDATFAGQSSQSHEDVKPIKGEGGVDPDEDDGADESDGDGISRGKLWSWMGHGKNSISALKFAPYDHANLYSSSYDCTLRKIDFERGISVEIIDADRFTWEGLIHAFDFSPDGHQLWASDNNGGILHRDLRESIDNVRRWEVDGAKIGCISINQSNPNLAVTAHLKREMRLWDLRKLTSIPSEGRDQKVKKSDITTEDCVVATYNYGKACSSAYFSPSGKQILSTSYDDRLRIWDINPSTILETDNSSFEPKHSINHDNQVGRYVSVFKAQWALPSSPESSLLTNGAAVATPQFASPHFTVASMKRRLQIYSSQTGKLVNEFYDEDWVTAVPAVTAGRGGRYFGGTGAGKISMWC